jgi:hypothetical protein
MQRLKCRSHVSWAEAKDPRHFPKRTRSLFLSNFVHKFVYIPVREHFSIAKIIYQRDRCGIARSWLNRMIIIHVHLVLGTIKGHSKTCSFTSQILRERSIGMLTAGMSTKAVARESNVYFSTISCVQRLVWVSGLPTSTLWTEYLMVAVGLWYGQA